MRPREIVKLVSSLRRPTPGRLRLVRDYLSVERSGTFDRAFYLAAHPEVATAGVDPLLDYLDEGWRAGRDPSATFSTRAYLAARPDVGAVGMNPLVHSVRYGRVSEAGDGQRRSPAAALGAGARAVRRSQVLHPRSLRASARALLRRRASRDGAGEWTWPRPVTVIVPIYNAAEDLERCLDALVRNTSGAARLLLIDDASPDPRIGRLLDRCEGLPDVEILRNEENLGYTRTVNRGIEHAPGDVVLLNSDTEVTPRWLERLSRAAASDASIGTATAISNHAGAFSVPEIAVENPLPRGLGKDEVGHLVAQASSHRLPSTPTGSGFCLYVKRAVLEDIGLFDAESFPRGYGEENDFCMRASKRGWRHVVDDSTFVHHRREASFGVEKAELLPGARARVSELHPEYDGLVRRFVHSRDMRRVRRDIAAAFAAAESRGTRPRRRILFVLHEGGGGTIETSRDLMSGLGEEYEPYLLTSNGRRIRLWRRSAGGLEELERWRVSPAWRPTDFARRDFRAIARQVLTEREIELVHVRHLMKHTFDLPHAAAELRIPVVVSFHDYYLSCPTVHLIDDRGRYCGGLCSPGSGACRIPSRLLRDLPPLKHRFVYRWRAEVATMLETASAVVTTSEHTREVYLRSLPLLRGKRFEVIPHGRDLDQHRGVAVPPPEAGPVRILVAGNLDFHKGGDYIRALREADVEGRLEFHFLGTVAEEYGDLGVRHGPYDRGSFADRVREIAPSFVGIFSIWAETYNHILTEAWSAGVPVLVTDIGALGERVGEHGGGWPLPVDDPAGACARILEIAGDPAEYGREAEHADLAGLPDIAAMTRSYERLYDSVLAGERAFAAPDGVPRSPRRRVGRLELAVYVPGGGGHYPGSTHVRVLRRLEHPTIRPRIAARVQTPDGPPRLAPSADLALVQRTGIAPEHVAPFLGEVRAGKVPLVVELDDDLLGKGASDPSYGAHLDSLCALLEAADLVTVSTETLREALAGRAERIAVVPNMLDERLWVSELDREETSGRGSESTVRLVYIGTTTHRDDLALLRPVLELLRSDYGLDVELSVIGGEPATDEAAWYRRVPVPRGCSVYPRFVEWLRRERSRWDIAVGPLADTAFNRSKSDLKFLEYSGLGLPGVYSDVPSFATVVDGTTGLGTANTSESWAATLARLWGDAALRERIREAAQTYVLTERCLGHSAEDYLDLLSGLLVDEGAALRAGERLAAAGRARVAAPRALPTVQLATR